MVDAITAELLRPALYVVLATAVVAGFVRGMAGFGAGLILTPVFSAFYGPLLAVPALNLTDWSMGMPITTRAWRQCRWRDVLPLLLPAMAMIPVGAWLLRYTDPVLLRIAMSGFILVAVSLMAAGWRYRGTPGVAVTTLVGMVSGTIGGAIGMSGPPVVLFWLAGQADAARARLNTFAYFGVLGVVTIATFAFHGLFTVRTLALTACLMPAYGLGLFLGARAFARVSEGVFRWIAFGLIGATSLVTLLVALNEALSR